MNCSALHARSDGLVCRRALQVALVNEAGDGPHTLVVVKALAGMAVAEVRQGEGVIALAVDGVARGQRAEERAARVKATRRLSGAARQQGVDPPSTGRTASAS